MPGRGSGRRREGRDPVPAIRAALGPDDGVLVNVDTEKWDVARKHVVEEFEPEADPAPEVDHTLGMVSRHLLDDPPALGELCSMVRLKPPSELSGMPLSFLRVTCR